MEDEKINHLSDEGSINGNPTIQPESTSKDTQLPNPETAEHDPATTGIETEEPEWVTGFKLALIISAITMAAFLMLLDVSIVAAVRPSSLLFMISY